MVIKYKFFSFFLNLILNRDTAGQERFRSLTASFFRDAVGFLLVFDLTNETSFINVRNWIGEIQANAYSENVNLILVGNKNDLETERIITKARAIEFAEQHNVNYIETSALHNINVGEAIESLLDSVMDNLEANLSKPNQNPVILLNNQIARDLMETNRTKPVPKKSYCCSY
jgi:GTPase SAR1 family protein